MTIDPSVPINYLDAGLSVLPAIRERKHPAVGSWKAYQDRLPSEEEIAAWFSNKQNALCLVCGTISGNLEVIDFDNGGELFEKMRYQGAGSSMINPTRITTPKEAFGNMGIKYKFARGYAVSKQVKARAASCRKPIRTVPHRRGASCEYDENKQQNNSLIQIGDFTND